MDVNEPFDHDQTQVGAGTTGWTADDLDDPRIAAQREAGRFQIFEGVLATEPPAFFDTSAPLTRLVFAVQTYLNDRGSKDTFAFKIDLELSNLKIRARTRFAYPLKTRKSKSAGGVPERPSS